MDIYIYMYIHTCVCIYIYIYIFFRERDIEREREMMLCCCLGGPSVSSSQALVSATGKAYLMWEDRFYTPPPSGSNF